MSNYYDFYATYLDLPTGSDTDFVSCHCPFKDNHAHGDKTGSAGVNLKNGVFNCFVCGAMSAYKFLLTVDKSLTPPEAAAILDDYRRNTGIIEKTETFTASRVIDPKWSRMVKKAREADLRSLDIALEYAESRGLTIESLMSLGVGYLSYEDTHWERDSLVFPYEINGKVVGIRYRDSQGNKGGEPRCHFTIWGADELADYPEDSPRIAVVNEGESDRIKSWQILRANGLPYPVVGTPTATFRHEWVREFEGFYKIIWVPQDDEPSIKATEKFKDYFKDRAVILKLPWRRRQMGKDLCEWCAYNSDKEYVDRIQTHVGEINNRLLTGIEFEQVANKPRHYLIHKLLARRQVAVIAGPPKAFKTWVALNMVRCFLIPGEHLFGIPELYSLEKDLKVLIVEEEGDAEELYQRAKLVLGDIPDWQQRTLWSHHLGVRLDQEDWVDRVSGWISEHNIDVVIFDPLQRLHGKDENSAAEMGDVWTAIHHLTTKFKNLAAIILHHFNKTGGVEDEWEALRGSSRTAAEADLGIFCDRLPLNLGKGCKIRLSGRTLPDLDVYDEGSHTLKLPFNPSNGLLLYNSNLVGVEKHLVFAEAMKSKGIWTVQEAAKYFKVTTNTINNWIKMLPTGTIRKTAASPGQPAQLFYNEVTEEK